MECDGGEGVGDGEGGQGGRRRARSGRWWVQGEVPADGFGERPVGAVGDLEAVPDTLIDYLRGPGSPGATC